MRRRTALVLVPLLAALAGPPASAAAPARTKPPTALVSLGDSYISGEAGRWQGNSAIAVADRQGTDRAYVPAVVGGTYDPTRVYGETTGACHRSDVAPALSNAVPVDVKINLACSGARTHNVVRGSSGGTGQNGEAPQADQLSGVAAGHDVELVVLSIGGNDLGFASIVLACTTGYVTRTSRCAESQQAAVDARMPAAMEGVRRAIDDVRAVLADAGQKPRSYRFVLQSYPSPIPRAAENRYPEGDPQRESVGGCPFWNSDSDWARDSLVPQISSALAAVAAEQGVQFLDLSDAFAGREACATSSAQSDGTPSGETDEWARFLTQSPVQGMTQEALHPNAFGQQAMGRCWTLLAASTSTAPVRCANTPGAGSEGMWLQPSG